CVPTVFHSPTKRPKAFSAGLGIDASFCDPFAITLESYMAAQRRGERRAGTILTMARRWRPVRSTYSWTSLLPYLLQTIKQPANAPLFDHCAPVTVTKALSANAEREHSLDLRQRGTGYCRRALVHFACDFRPIRKVGPALF